MNNTINAFRLAQAQFDHIAELLNLEPQVSEILVDGKKAQIIRKRQTYKDLVNKELIV